MENRFGKKAIDLVEYAKWKLGSTRMIVSTFSSLMHTLVDLNNQKDLGPEIKGWFAFATQKLDEVVTIAKAVTDGLESVKKALAENKKSIEACNSLRYYCWLYYKEQAIFYY